MQSDGLGSVYGGKDLWKRWIFSLEWKYIRVMDVESGDEFTRVECMRRVWIVVLLVQLNKLIYLSFYRVLINVYFNHCYALYKRRLLEPWCSVHLLPAGSARRAALPVLKIFIHHTMVAIKKQCLTKLQLVALYSIYNMSYSTVLLLLTCRFWGFSLHRSRTKVKFGKEERTVN